jgi:hypothetical protein
MVSPWPQTSLPRHANSIKKFENLQALVSIFVFVSPSTPHMQPGFM